MRWITEARHVLDRIEQTQLGAIEEASQIAARAIAADGVAHVFGTGHSRIPVEELFPRYGSFPGFHPIVELSMTFHTQVVGANGQRQAMFIERMPGLADVIWGNFQMRPTDCLLVFSASGRNAVPVEMAMAAKKAGMPVIAVVSLAESTAAAASHSSGTRLTDHADVVIDVCTPVGDAICQVDGLEEPVGPASTLANVAIVNMLKVRVAELLVESGWTPPVITSAQLVGPERSEELFEAAYLEHARRSASVLRVGPA
ncbi:sugar isomerase domain-containing protein [Pedococcus sp. NPDC057267]|uniref:sugar isomerase domain-containing protein n=1 Tax=Pedococcus sp. NPDC057267 TaxID=3346077 RepID=UPI00362881C8